MLLRCRLFRITLLRMTPMAYVFLILTFLVSAYITFTWTPYPEREYNDNTNIKFIARDKQLCVQPTLELWPPDLSLLFSDPKPLLCSEVDPNWVYVDNGTFMISPEAEKVGVLCEYVPIVRGSGDFQILEGEKIRPMISGMEINSDCFEAKCVSNSGKVYHNLHLGIAKNKPIQFRKQKLPQNSMGLNILMFGFDSVSRMTWMRNLPKSYDYFVNILNGSVLQGYNIVGDGTPQALIPILTGKNETELPESRRGHTERTVDDHPWIWRDLRDAGYVTQWGEDGQAYGTFTYRMNGFKAPPVDHYMRPYYLRAESKWYRKNYQYCLGALPRHKVMLNWIEDMYKSYPDKPKFSFLFHSEMTHGGYSEVRAVDDDLTDLLKTLSDKNFLNNTILILMSDHGARFVQIRRTLQGKYEERMPFFAVRLPPWFKEVYPKAHGHFQKNIHRLTTPYDIHATFRDILSYNPDQILPNPLPRSISLFKEIPESRTCKDAHIEPHWCACLQWKPVPLSDRNVQKAAGSVLDAINSLTEDHRTLCAQLTLREINSAVRYGHNVNVLKFKKSSDSDGYNPDLSDQMTSHVILYQITITSYPGDGKFEATVKYNFMKKSFKTNAREISRVNRYGDAPKCIQDKYPHLRPYCYCM